MTTNLSMQLSPELQYEEQVLRKVFMRIIPFLFILMVIASLDRINVGFAALAMNKELGLTATMFGLANSLFFVGAMLCEIPSNLLMVRFGARRWIARIMISWGIVSAGCMLAQGAHSLYLARFLLGVTEAGFTPGIVLFITYWFPNTYRARASGVFFLAMPVTMTIGASISGFILDHTHGTWGLAGWRWLFVMEALPAVLLGFVTLFYLNDSPAQAKWLNREEKAALERRLLREQSPPVEKKVLREVFSRDLLLLAVIYFGMVTTLATTSFWTPQIVRELFKSRSFSYVGLFTALPALLAGILSVVWGARSDKRSERTFHFMAPMLLAVVGWLMVAFIAGPPGRMLGLVFVTVGAFSGQVVFWGLAPQIMSPAARPVGIAFIYTCGTIASIFQFGIMGFLRDLTHSWVSGLMYEAAWLLVAAILVLTLRVKTKAPAAAASAHAD